jgi:multiple sugar transport system ATP-binding protein
LAGLEPQTKGAIFLDGREVSRLAPRERDMAMIFDNLALYPNKNGFENLASPLAQRKRPMAEIRQKVFAMAEKLNLTLVLDRLPKTMSGGEKQRLALGRALVREPRFFLLDEPLSSLDAPLRFKLRSELKRLQKLEGHSFLMATPDFSEALAVGDRIVALHEGKVVQVGGPDEIYCRPADTRTALFVGSPQINLLKATLAGGELRFLGLSCPCPPALEEALGDYAGEFTLGLRPENAAIAVSPAEPEPGAAGGSAPLVDVESLGRTVAATVKVGEELLTVLASSDLLGQAAIGEKVGFQVKDLGSLQAFRPDGRNFLA